MCVLGLVIENERDDRKLEKLSLRKQLRLKSQEHQSVNPGYDTPMTGMDTSSIANRPGTMPAHADGHNIYLNEYQNANGKRTFQAKVTKNITNCYTIETVIDGKPLRGVLFSNNVSNKKPGADDLRRLEILLVTNIYRINECTLCILNFCGYWSCKHQEKGCG